MGLRLFSPRSLLLALICLLAATQAGAGTVKEVRLGKHEDFARCVIELDTPVSFRYRNASADEQTVSIELSGVTSAPTSVNIHAQSPLVSESLLNFYGDRSTLYVHIQTTAEVRVETQRLQNPVRIVFDLYGDAASASPAAAPLAAAGPMPATPSGYSSSVSAIANRPRTIVIDPGHGGHHRGGFGFLRSSKGAKGAEVLTGQFRRDYGFTYGRRIVEAETTLPIALKLERLLAADPMFEPRLTRRSDVYVGLRERTRRAEQFGGDYFVSIHYNAVPEKTPKTARGIEVFTWSPKEGDTVGARYLQQLDNEEGGSSDLSSAGSAAREVLSQMMVDALEEQALESRAAGKALEKALLRDSYFKKNYRGLKSARFKVLENYNMPSLLVEVGFISHPEEAALAASSAFQERTARVLYEGIVAYFEANDPTFRAERARIVAGK
ncbi:MAG: N-acetylmuramoyl-L-alanine amidase [Candidatus Sumerlaeota bacterium]|nr:N-acetylmuramoyl-L-alanine amidase [Candidatus Sumerlaeota bacterium]